MKEIRFFYVPNASTTVELPDDEATHALRVLRMESGDEMMLTELKKRLSNHLNRTLIYIWLWLPQKIWTGLNGLPKKQQR